MDKKFCPYCMNLIKEGETCTNCGLTEGVYTPRDHHLPLGSVLNDRYLVGRVLGEGGFGITYIGCDLNLEMKVAIKEYFPIDRVYRFSNASLDVSNYSHAAEKFHSGKVKFLREARTMARLDKQQNIVSVKDFFEKNNTAYIVMEYVEGTTLKELVNQRGGRIPAGELLYMLAPLFPALTSVHELGLIHRDISPDNLMLENGKIILLDFGCARESASQSETMTIALKQGYAPIEQYQHKGQGPWTDVYALAATIYYCLTGKTPQSAVDRLNEEELVPPRKLGVDLTTDQEEALLKGMSVKAKDRFQSAEELFTALYTGVLTEPILSEPEAKPASSRHETVEPAPEKSVQAETVLSESTPSESVSEENSDTVEKVQNTVSDNGSKPSLVEASTSPETDRDQKQSVKDRIIAALNAFKQQLKDRDPVVILACSAVLLVAVICVVWIVIPSKGDTELPVSAEGNDGSTDTPQPETQDDPVKEPAEETETVETLFANAVALEESSIGSLQRLMDDETVPAIRISEELDVSEINGAITITKPVLIEENVSFTVYDPITVQGENAWLWIEGKLEGDYVIQTVDGGRVVADDQDCLYPTVLWLADWDDLQILNGDERKCDKLILCEKNSLVQDAVEVNNETLLRWAVSAAKIAIICEDMTIEEDLTFRYPILIKEGVTLVLQNNASLIADGKNGIFQPVLWNEGSIQGGHIQADSSTEIINYGEIRADILSVEDTIVNFGEVAVNEFRNANEQSKICNIGTLRFQNEMSIDYPYNLINYGTVICSSPRFIVNDNIKCVNYGEFRIEEGVVCIQTYLKNMSDGRIVVCDNAILENRGVIDMYSGEFVSESRGNVYNEFGVIYYNNYTDNYPEDGWVHFTNVHNGLDKDRICQVENFDELYNALQDPEVDKIYLIGTVSWSIKDPLTLTKEMEIQDSAELIMEEGTELILDGCFLQNNGFIKVDYLTLTHGASLRNFCGTIELNASKSVISMGNMKGEENYSGTDCLVNDNGEILHYSKMDLYDNALVIQNGHMEGPLFNIIGDAYVANRGDIQWGN